MGVSHMSRPRLGEENSLAWPLQLMSSGTRTGECPCAFHLAPLPRLLYACFHLSHGAKANTLAFALQ